MTGDRRIEDRGPVAHPQGSEYARPLRAGMMRALVEGLLVHAHCGVTVEERASRQTLQVDLEYTYRAGEGDEIEHTIDYGGVLRAEVLEREEFKLLETGVRRVGKHVLSGYSEIREINVRVTKLNVPVAQTVSGVSVEATFSR
jgi:dihydroneopterin aldolase